VIALLGASACSSDDKASSSPEAPPRIVAEEATYVGASECASCHEKEYQAWLGSHHDLALQVANEDTVLAGAPSEYAGFAFAKTDKGFTVRPDASSKEFDVHYTFGVEPLQQYVIESEPGRLQVLPTPWDMRAKNDGGQRWYSLFPEEYPVGDPMHWNGRAASWNGMCADCHSTGIRKNYDPVSRTYATTFEEEDVACEACHGPGSSHSSAAKAGLPVEGLLAHMNSQDGQINSCAQCHSRRSQLKEGFEPGESFFDYYQPTLLRDGLYHIDGQILDEVYVYGSFLQSRMHLQGVSCSNCHDPHTAELKFEGNAVCTQCHNPAGRADFPTLKPGLYDDPEHHFHPTASEGSSCVSCHMPAETYMGVDVRNDHSFRIPRPDLTEQLGVPNTCSSCHDDRTPAWANEIIEARFGERPAHYGRTFALAQLGYANADEALAALAADDNVPVMVRANAVATMANLQGAETLPRLDSLWIAKDGHPLLRLGVTEGAAGLPPQRQWQLVSPLLDDEYLAVRMAAFSALLPVAGEPEIAERLRPYLSDYLNSLTATLDFPETQLNIANAQAVFGNSAAAELALKEALALQSNFVPALLNLTDLYRATGRDSEGEELLKRAMRAAPDWGAPVFAYANWLTRQQQSAEALNHYKQAAELEPSQLQYSYTLVIALNDSGEGDEAIEVLESALTRWPGSSELLNLRIFILRDLGRRDEALMHVEKLLEANPADLGLQALREQLRF
jgi:predicted CXXCH cytochrome family protein